MGKGLNTRDLRPFGKMVVEGIKLKDHVVDKSSIQGPDLPFRKFIMMPDTITKLNETLSFFKVWRLK